MKYNKNHCTSSVRGVKKVGQLEYILTGTHAFQWTINILFRQKVIRSTTFPNRIAAMREWGLIHI
jgi:hypothetical protein